MTVPLIILAAGTVIAGYINLPAGILHTFGSHADYGTIGTFLHPVVESAQQTAEYYRMAADDTTHGGEHSLVLEWMLMILSTIIVIGSIWFARKLYLLRGPAGGERIARAAGPFFRFSYNKW